MIYNSAIVLELHLANQRSSSEDALLRRRHISTPQRDSVQSKSQVEGLILFHQMSSYFGGNSMSYADTDMC